MWGHDGGAGMWWQGSRVARGAQLGMLMDLLSPKPEGILSVQRHAERLVMSGESDHSAAGAGKVGRMRRHVAD